jgi:hypothetical protein
MQVDFGRTADGKYQLTQWPQLMHRKITHELMDNLEEIYPQYHFEIMTIYEKKSCHDRVDPSRVRIYTDTDGIIIKIPTNG